MIENFGDIYIRGHRLRIQQIIHSHTPDSQKDTTLVFLHEGLGSIDHWKRFPSRLCRALEINGLVYDRKGYGKSEPYKAIWSKNYLIEEATADLPELLKFCGIQKAILVGHSDGGSIALLAAATLKNVVTGAITEAAHIFVENETLEGIRQFVEIYTKNNYLKKKLSYYHGENTDIVVNRWANTWLCTDFRDWNIESFLPKITVPLLVIQGEKDEYATEKQVKRIVDQVSGPVLWEIIPDCGHTPHLQQSEHTLAIMSRFILSVV